jgi:hypothetical protein
MIAVTHRRDSQNSLGLGDKSDTCEVPLWEAAYPHTPCRRRQLRQAGRSRPCRPRYLHLHSKQLQGNYSCASLARRSCLEYERERHHVHHVRFGSETISMTSESDFSQATYLTWWIMTGNGASVSLFSPSNLPWSGRVMLPTRATTTSESESLFQKTRSLVKSDAHGQVRRPLIPVFWENWRECASCFLELCKTLHSQIPRRSSPWSWYSLSVLDSMGRPDLIGCCLPGSVAPDVQRSVQCTGNSK